MYRNIIVIMVVAIAFLGISINAVAADSNQLNVKPVSPASKIKTPTNIAVPSPAPAPVVEPTPTKSVPDVAPKPTPSLTTKPKPVKKLPAPQQVSPTPTPSKSPAISSLPKVKPTGPTTSLPQGVKQNRLPAAQVPANLGQSTKIPGGAAKDITNNNRINSRLPGHATPVSGFGSRSGAAGLTQGVGGQGNRVGLGSQSLVDKNPVMRTGRGAQREGDDTEDPANFDHVNHYEGGDFTHMDEDGFDSKEPGSEITFTEEEASADYHLYKADYYTDDALWLADTVQQDLEEDEESQPPPELDTSEEKLADDGPTDGNLNGNNIDRRKLIGIFGSTGGGIDFAPGEEPTTGGTIDPELLQAIQSSKTQVNTVDGVDLNSNNFENLSENAQQAIKNRGQGNPVSDK